jgi:hypothetical protein
MECDDDDDDDDNDDGVDWTPVLTTTLAIIMGWEQRVYVEGC